MTTTLHESLELIGRGSEADVYFNRLNNSVVKRFDRLPVEVARVKAETEFATLKEAHLRTVDELYVSVPKPIGLSPDGLGMEMGFVAGSSLLTQLLKGTFDNQEIERLASAMATGLLLLNRDSHFLQSDCTLDHVYPASDGSITFLDFGNGSSELDGIQYSNMTDVLADLIGSTLYECSRLSRTASKRQLTHVRYFLKVLMAHLQIPFDETLERMSRGRLLFRYASGSISRKLYYDLSSSRVISFFFPTLRESAGSVGVGSGGAGSGSAGSVGAGGLGLGSAGVEGGAVGVRAVGVDDDAVGVEGGAGLGSAGVEDGPVGGAVGVGSMGVEDEGADQGLRALFFVVGDFPEAIEELNNGIHKAVYGLVEGIASHLSADMGTDAPGADSSGASGVSEVGAVGVELLDAAGGNTLGAAGGSEVNAAGASEMGAAVNDAEAPSAVEHRSQSNRVDFNGPVKPSLYILAVGSRDYELVQNGFTIRFFTSKLKLARFIGSAGKSGLTIFNSIFCPFNNMVGWLITRKGCPYVVHPHLEFSDNLFAKNRIRKAIYWRLFDRPFLRSAVGVHLLDSRQKTRLQDLGIETCSFAAPNGVSELILSASPKATWTRTGPVRFFFFGRLDVGTKGLDLMMEAVSNITKDESIQVYVQGPGEEGWAWMENEIQLRGLTDSVFLIPPDFIGNPIDIMAKYDVFLLPSRFEGFPTACVEAMMAARPMVVTDVGGLSPILEDYDLGIVVQPAAESIEAGMRRAIASRPEWESMGKRAQQFAKSRFKWTDIGRYVYSELETCHSDQHPPSQKRDNGESVSTHGKLLLCAYACSPDRGSEESVGWDTATLLAERGHDVFVITRKSELVACRNSISKLDPLHRPILIPIDIPYTARFLFGKMGKIGVDWSYFWWLLAARKVVKSLHKRHQFTSTQHVTYARYWMPSPLSQLDIPFVWGPVGGGESIPDTLKGWFSWSGKVFEWVRDTMRFLGQSLPSVSINASRSRYALANTKETAAKMALLGANNIQILNSAALSQKDQFLLSNATSRFDETTFISVGRLLEWKGFQWGLEAFAKANLPNARYLIVGTGPFEKPLRQKAQDLGIEHKVEFLGAIPRAELFGMMASSHALVHPSMHESGGYVCLEMMAAGNPVICIDAGGPAHFVDATCGFVATVDSSESMVKEMALAMKTIHDSPEVVKKLGWVGQQRVKSKFSMRAKVDELDRIHKGFLVPNNRTKPVRTRPTLQLGGGVL